MKSIRSKCAILLGVLIVLLIHPHDYLLSQTQKQSDAEVEALFDKAAAKHKRELDSLRATRGIGSAEPRDVSVRSLAAVLVSGDASRSGYLPKTSILFYSYDQGTLSTWLVDESGVRANEQKKLSQEELATAISNLRSSLNVDALQALRTPHKRGYSAGVGNSNPKLPLNQTVGLATEILLPRSIADSLASVEHLIVVPVFGIGTVPFAMLQPFGADSFLIDKMSISLAPSLFDIREMFSPWRPDFSSPLVVGNPFVTPTDKWVIPTLPGAQKEAEEVAKALNTKPLVGKEATKLIISERAYKSDILYFATHGVASSDDPLSGGFLLLSGPTVEKGKWTAGEVQDMELERAKIVVLSACQTGLGKVHDAGIIGLARAFQIAGSPRVVMSLWNVNDAATSELMQKFIDNMRSDTPAEALRKAMIKTRETRPNPSDWASFVLFGTPR